MWRSKIVLNDLRFSHDFELPVFYVSFPMLRNVDMAEYLSSDADVLKAHPCTQYDLIANICHEGSPGTVQWFFKLQYCVDIVC